MRKRKTIRLKNYNYSSPGDYFITICTKNNKFFFIENKTKQIANNCWEEIPQHFNNVELDEFIIMPNHIHGIIVIIDAVGARHALPLQNKRQHQMLPKVIGLFKSCVTKKIHQFNPDFQWQKSYYEHVIRNEKELDNIRKYINENPIKWNEDKENPKTKINLKDYYNNIYKGEF